MLEDRQKLFHFDYHIPFSRNPLEVSEEFVQEYNNAKLYDENVRSARLTGGQDEPKINKVLERAEQLEQTAQKMLERAKVG